MPPKLDRCVADLKKRGVTTSSAFAICTASLQKSGTLPPSRKKEDVDTVFDEMAKRTSLPVQLRAGFRRSFDDFTPSDESLISKLKRIDLVEMDNVLGLAKLHSKNIRINHKSLVRLGNKSLWYGAVIIHEAMHAIHGFGEQEATHSEQRFCGKVFGQSVLGFDKPIMFEAMKAAAMAQGQREVDVHGRHRKSDFRFLVSVGYTTRVARKILEAGVMIGKNITDRRIKQSIQAQLQAHQFYMEDMPKFDTLIEKTVTKEMTMMLESLLVDDSVTKTLPMSLGRPHYYDVRENAGLLFWQNHHPSFRETFEFYVFMSNRRPGFKVLRGPSGVVPMIRRAECDINKLSEADETMRKAAIIEAIPDVAEQGLFREDGEPTDAHLHMILHGFSPVMTKLLQDHNDYISNQS